MLLTKQDVKAIIPRFATTTPDDIFLAHLNNVITFKLPEVFAQELIDALDAIESLSPGSELKTFYVTYARPYIIYEFFADFMTFHGIAITQAGAFDLTSDNHVAIGKSDRHLIIEDARNKANYTRKKMMNAYYAASRTFDGTAYPIIHISAKSNTGGIRTIGRVKNFGMYNPDNTNFSNPKN